VKIAREPWSGNRAQRLCKKNESLPCSYVDTYSTHSTNFSVGLFSPGRVRCVAPRASANVASAAWSGRALAVGVKTELGGLDVWPCGIVCCSLCGLTHPPSIQGSRGAPNGCLVDGVGERGCPSKGFALTWYRALTWYSSPARPFAAPDVPLLVTGQQGSPSPACRQLSRAPNACAGGSSKGSTTLKHGTKLGRTLATCWIDIHVFLWRNHRIWITHSVWLTLDMTGTRTYSRRMYSQNRLNMNRIPSSLPRSAYSTCRVGALGSSVVRADFSVTRSVVRE